MTQPDPTAPTVVFPKVTFPEQAPDPTPRPGAGSAGAAGGTYPADAGPDPAAGTAADTEASAGKRALSDGLSLSISGAVGSLAGLISWVIAARIMPQEAVGYASAFVNAFLLVAGVAQLNLDSAMMLWMPRAGNKASTLFWRSQWVIIPSCAVVGVLYLIVFPDIARTGGGGEHSVLLGGLLFVVAAIGWGLWGVHDFSLIAIGKPWWASWRNIIFAVVRIGLLVALGVSLEAQGVVLSWVLPIVAFTVASALIGGVVIARSARRSTAGRLPTRAEAVKFLGPTTLAHWGTVMLFNQIPVIAVYRFGAAPGAAFFIAWQAVMVIDITAGRFMQSLSAQIARDPEHTREHIRASRKRLLMLFLPMVVGGILLAELGLQIFGPGYAEAADVLRVLLAGVVARLLISHELGVRQALHDGVGYARLQLISVALVMAAVLFIPVQAGATGEYSVGDLMPVAIGYTVSQALVALALWLLPGLRRRNVTPAAS